MKAWEASNGGARPEPEVLRQLRESGLTQQQIADKYDVSRQAVQYWLRAAGEPPSRRPRSHKRDVLPWTVRGEDHRDSIARALRFWNRHRHGEQLSEGNEREMRHLIDYLDETQTVVDYDRARGFLLRHRRSTDAADEYIRRPTA